MANKKKAKILAYKFIDEAIDNYYMDENKQWFIDYNHGLIHYRDFCNELEIIGRELRDRQRKLKGEHNEK